MDAPAGEARFRSLYEQHRLDVLAYFLRRLGREDAAESAAEVFLIAWRRISDVPAGSDGRAWLFGVARNVLRNRERTNRRIHRLVSRLAGTGSNPKATPEIVVVQREQDRAVLEAMDRLRPGDREVLRLRLWEEADYDEIASVLGCSRHAAEQRYAKALRRFRSAYRWSGHVDEKGPDPQTQVDRHAE
jgi:RNA polymerase sigma-70 factor (ECF subfamily)